MKPNRAKQLQQGSPILALPIQASNWKKTWIQNMDRENVHHWGATREDMDINRRRNNSPETRRLVEQRNTISRREPWYPGLTIKPSERYLHQPTKWK